MIGKEFGNSVDINYVSDLTPRWYCVVDVWDNSWTTVLELEKWLSGTWKMGWLPLRNVIK